MDFSFDSIYDCCLDFINKSRLMGKDWEEILLLKEDKNLEILFPSDYKEKWDSLVEYMKKIEEDTKQATGYIYSDEIDNNIQISQSPRSAWNVFKKNRLIKYGEETAKSNEMSAKKILDRLKLESLNQEAGKGLVMGYVQSGKTMNIESVITMGADIGFNIFIMLSGTIENLRKQGLKRLQKDIEYTESSNIQWKFFDDIKSGANIDGLLENNMARIVTVCLKHSTRLNNLKKWLIDSTSDVTKQKMKVLIIDDEADQASINTKKMDFKKETQERSKINKLIVEIVGCQKFKALNYISYTATPYANFLNEKERESLYPRNFIISLPKSKQYIGASEIFGNRSNISDGLNIKNPINKDEIENFKNKKSDRIPKSLADAICWFICTLAVQRLRNYKKPVTMLIHTDNKHYIHTKTYEMVNTWIIENKSTLLEKCRDVYAQQTKKFTKENFFEVMKEYNFDGKHDVKDYPKFEELEEEINIILNDKVSHILISEKGKLEYHKGIHIVIDNCNNKKGIDENGDFIRLAYPEEDEVDYASGIIVIGGNTLARGLTLYGLTTSYFARAVTQVDSLMQMGRWFGYREDYELLPRIWLTDNTLLKFCDIAYIEHRLREDLKRFDLGVKPSEYAPKIQTSYLTRFSLTAKNKSQNASKCGATYEKVDNQTVVFSNDLEKQKENLELTIKFLEKIIDNYTLTNNTVDSNYVWNNVNFSLIKDELLSRMHFYENDRFYGNIKDFIEWTKETQKDELWDVILESPKEDDAPESYLQIKDIRVQKVNRSKRTLTSQEDVIDIGVLRNPKDEKNAYYYEEGVEGTKEQVRRPKLFIYVIDKKSKAKQDTNRSDLGFESDIVGLYMYVPNTDEKDKDRTILTQIM